MYRISSWPLSPHQLLLLLCSSTCQSQCRNLALLASLPCQHQGQGLARSILLGWWLRGHPSRPHRPAMVIKGCCFCLPPSQSFSEEELPLSSPDQPGPWPPQHCSYTQGGGTEG